MPADKPRIFHSSRDMILSLGALLIFIVPALWLTGMCSVGQPEITVEQRVDAKAILTMDANGLDFPIRYPELPDGYVATSARRSDIAGQPSSMTGYLSPDAAYVELVQTDAPASAFLNGLDNKARQRAGTTVVNGTEFVIYEGKDARTLWVADLGEVRIGITGSGDDAVYPAMAEAVTAARPITPLRATN